MLRHVQSILNPTCHAFFCLRGNGPFIFKIRATTVIVLFELSILKKLEYWSKMHGKPCLTIPFTYLGTNVIHIKFRV